MPLDQHAIHLGGLIANLQSLEFLLRAFLQKLASARPLGIPYGTDVYSYPVGTELPESELTSYDSLGQLIDKYNAEMRKLGHPKIDPTLVELRDALAHGRVSAGTIDENLRLVKFDRPINGRVRVSFNEALTTSWFTKQKKRVYDAAQSVYSHVEEN